MYLLNAYDQKGLHRSFRADGTLSGSNTAQLILPVAMSRCMLMVMNISTHTMFLEHGPPRMTVQISGGSVTGCTVTNGGFNYTKPPSIQFEGGFLPFVANATWNGLGLIGSQSPSGLATQGITTNPTFNRVARAHCVLTTGVVTSVVIDDPGFGYINPPEAILKNNNEDPFGCASPFFGNANSGVALPATNGFYYINGTSCWTDAVSLSGTSGDAFTVEYML